MCDPPSMDPAIPQGFTCNGDSLDPDEPDCCKHPERIEFKPRLSDSARMGVPAAAAGWILVAVIVFGCTAAVGAAFAFGKWQTWKSLKAEEVRCNAMPELCGCLSISCFDDRRMSGNGEKLRSATKNCSKIKTLLLTTKAMTRMNDGHGSQSSAARVRHWQ